jgi:two-component system chemotaxis sensor kinase CheA
VRLEFRPIVRDAAVSKIMLLATDETDRRKLLREMERQGALHKSQLAVMRRVASGGGQQFVAFLEHARRRFQRAREILREGDLASTPTSQGELFQSVHTLRAEAQSFELVELVELLRGLEERLSALRRASERGATAGQTSEKVDLDPLISSAIELVAQSEALFVEASPSGRAALDQAMVSKRELARLLELCAGRSDLVAQALFRLASRPFGDCVASLVEQASHWAEKENKRVRVEVDGRETPVPPGLADVLGGVLTHLVRNAIAHGIEPVSERLSLGKSPVGSIDLVCRTEESGSTVLFVDDDGRGISENSLLLEAAENRRPLSNLAQSSHSTRQEVTDLAGHGVGMPAVEADLARAGYAVSVARRAQGGTRFEIRPFTPGAS